MGLLVIDVKKYELILIYDELTEIEWWWIGDFVRSVFLNPSRKFNLLLDGLGVRGSSPSGSPLMEDRWWCCNIFPVECPSLFSSFLTTRSLLTAFDTAIVDGDAGTLALVITGSGVAPRLHIQEVTTNHKQNINTVLPFQCLYKIGRDSCLIVYRYIVRIIKNKPRHWNTRKSIILEDIRD